MVQRASQGDREAFGRLYSSYYPYLYTSLLFIARSHEDTQEVIHDTFLKIWKARETLVLVRSFEDYAYTLAKNLLFNQLKRKKISLKIVRSLAHPSIEHTVVTPECQLLYKQYFQTAVAAIDELPEQKRKIFLLRTQQGFSLNEISSEMGIAQATVKKHLYAAIEFVKKHLQQHTGELLILVFFFFL